MSIKSGYAAQVPQQQEFRGTRVAILATRWNTEVVGSLVAGARRCLLQWGVADADIALHYAPGAYETPLAALLLLDGGHCDGVIALGAVIRGDTPHFDFVAGECARGLMDVQLRTGRPVGFGVLTVNTPAQADERAGPGDDNKGYEAAAAVLEMIRLRRSLL